MQNSRPVLLTAAASGSVAIVGALFGADQLAAQAGLLALGALGVLVAARHEAARRVRWSLLAGIAVLAVAVAIPDILTSPVVGPQVLKPASGDTHSFVRDAVADEWLTILAVLLASAAFLWALTARPVAGPEPADAALTVKAEAEPVRTEPRRGHPAVLAAAVGALLIIVAVADLGLVVAGQKRQGEVGDLLTAVGIPLVVALFAIGTAVLGAYRVTRAAAVIDGTGVAGGTHDVDEVGPAEEAEAGGARNVAATAVAIGGLLLAIAALAVFYLGVLSAPLRYGDAGNLIFDTATVRTGWGDLDLIAALRLAGMLAGAGGIVYGAARTSPEARAAETVSPDGPSA
ncbi:hypothetical protein Q0Z83_018910 [Actinoplanes sichuanensis]|uniref:Uncharacterized protein n=1 Tax=Actinoplanes sichuanensis TaxID=512349 RepID=A0ABW4AKM1_9ACTN|nr:hypothetical protein [Actinoplanes sichuanensis]BEL03700.1 hypothetical protein Q0Z83_018910 [Actinoplanes sichuanensis]